MGSPALMVRDLVIDFFGDVEGIGIDVVDVHVLTDLITDGGQPFLDACWTPTEQADAHHEPERLAGRWAAKEAVMKCLGAGIGDIEPTDIEILTLPSGAPTVALHRQALTIANNRNVEGWRISISHETGWAASIAVAQRQHATPSTISSEGGPNPGGRNA